MFDRPLTEPRGSHATLNTIKQRFEPNNTGGVEQLHSINIAATRLNKNPGASNCSGPVHEAAAGAELRPKPADSAQSPQTKQVNIS